MSVILNNAAIQALQGAYEAFLESDRDAFEYEMSVAARAVNAIWELGYDDEHLGRELEVSHLYGECLLMSGFAHLDNPRKLTEIYRRAGEAMFWLPSRVLNREMAWLPHSCRDVFDFFHTPSRMADETAEDLSRALELYRKLTRDGAAGVNLLYRAGLALRRDQYEKAQLLAKKALFIGSDWLNGYAEELLRGLEEGTVAV